VAEQKLARFCDVFCEQGAFKLDETRRVLEAGLEHGLKPKIHAEQLSRSGSIDLAIELGAVSVDHLEHVTNQDASKLARSDTVAVLLPGATYFLGKKNFAPGRMLADAGCAVAVSTDFNPGSCMSQNLPLMLNMACIYSGIYPREALLAATRWAAQALDMDDRVGSLLPGHQADILVLNTPDYRNLVYHFGVPHTQMVIKAGKRVYSAA
jgi:imidazolonepropionase